ncbi:MAG: exodeoxyribonuclease V subunit alpha [Aquabacterium sp.]|nr:exodeoxyribonuclease V subunit alpha [Aquabacterium sp.]
MNATLALQWIERWRAAGALRALDLAFARWLHELDANVPGSLLLAAAVLSALEGQGHAGLPLDADPVAGDGEAPAWALPDWPQVMRDELEPLAAQWPRDAAAARVAWPHPRVVELEPADDQGGTPLVWVSLPGSPRLALRRYWRNEREVAAQVRARCVTEVAPDADVALRDAWLDRLFAPASTGSGGADRAQADAPDLQRSACLSALRSGFTVITGGPGTGKTYTAARLLVLVHALHRGPAPLRVALAAPTGKAASRLRSSIDAALADLQRDLATADAERPWPEHAAEVLHGAGAKATARTLHAWLGLHRGSGSTDAQPRTLNIDVMLLDEASMVHLELMADLLRALPRQARLVLLGDRDQLASVEAGAVLADVCEAAEAGPQAVPAVALQGSRRFGGAIGELARAVHAGRGAAALAVLQRSQTEPVAVALRTPADPAQMLTQLRAQGWAPGTDGAWSAYVAMLRERPREPRAHAAWVQALLAQADRFRVLCALRSGPWGAAGCNAAIDAALRRLGLPVPQGRLLMVTRNHQALDVYNGDIGVVLQPPGGGALRLYLTGERSVALSRLPDLDGAWALTVHKSQGSEFAHVALVLPPHDSALLTRELLYTGITRARDRLTLIAPQPAFIAAACARRTRRLGGLRALLAHGGWPCLDADEVA